VSITARYAAAQTIAAKAGRLAHRYFVQRNVLAVETKGTQDFVSHADRAVEALIRAEVERVNAELGTSGRVLVRPSGTEPVVRVLAEAETEEGATALCGRIAALVRRELG